MQVRDRGDCPRGGHLASDHPLSWGQSPNSPSLMGTVPPEAALLVPGVGVEPTLPFGKGFLKPSRMPFRHPGWDRMLAATAPRKSQDRGEAASATLANARRGP